MKRKIVVKERLTSQKKLILDYLKKTKCHPSSGKVYSEIRKKLPRISRGTVYRILKNLKEKGLIREIPCKVCHYDGDMSLHSHFFCQKCRNIIDVYKDFKICQDKEIKVGKVKNYRISFYGICKNCQKK